MRSIALVAVAMGLLVFVPPLVSFLDSSGARIYWIFAMTPMVLAVAVLSGIGMDVLVKSHSERRVRRVLGIGFAAMAVLLGIIWLVARRGLTPSQANIRSHSFIWPTIEVIAGLVVVWMLAKVATRTRTAPCSVCGRCRDRRRVVAPPCGDRFPSRFGCPPSLVQLPLPNLDSGGRILKACRWQCDRRLWSFACVPFNVGIMVNANLLYDVQEFAAYDPMTPHAYFSLYKTPTSVLAEYVDIFSPAITSTQAARLYGISYVLEPSGVPGPKGSVFDRRLGNEDLYRVPGAAAATLVALQTRWVVSRQIRDWCTRQSGSSEPQRLEDGHSQHYSKCPPPQTLQRAGLACHH